MSRIDVLGVGFDDLTLREAVEEALALIAAREGRYVVTPNPEIVMLAGRDDRLARSLREAAMVLPDGIGVIKGAAILGTPLRERVPGIDFASALMMALAAAGGSVYLFGAKPGVAEKAAKNLKEAYPGLQIAGCSDGYFTDDRAIIQRISASEPELLLCCLGAPKQENWMREHAGLPGVGLMAGLGGSLDVFAGEVKRAPESWRRLGLEWLYRLVREPKRIGRAAKLPLFVLRAVGERIKGKGRRS